MNIQILDSWLREHLKTKANASQIAKTLSLSSVSVEKLEKKGTDYLYHIEVTSNRPDLMSVLGIAREAAATLSEIGIEATFMPLNIDKKQISIKEKLPLTIVNDESITYRVLAAILEVKVKKSPKFIAERLESSNIRSLNNLIDITNYVMREVGHPCHVFDYDRIDTHKIIIRKSKKGEKIKTLDGKEHVLEGDDIVADNGKGEIIDLLGIMGVANSVVTENTKRIILFFDNNKPSQIRKTSMKQGIRSEAAILNEKGVDRELALTAMQRGIKLYEEFAEGKLLSNIIDIYPVKQKIKDIKISEKKIEKVIGVHIPIEKCKKILTKLSFEVKTIGKEIIVRPPSFRAEDITLPEDLIEEIGRIYGYDKLPSVIVPLFQTDEKQIEKDEYFLIKRVKNALKYWGFTECYTYSMVSEELLEGPTNDSVEIANPINEDMVYMRKTLIPSLLEVIKKNSTKKEIRIFEISNVYEKRGNKLPAEILHFAGIVKKNNLSFFEVKGILEQLLIDLGIKNVKFKESEREVNGASLFINKEYIGEIQIFDEDLINFELNLDEILKFVNLKKNYKPLSKFPPVIEDLAIIADENVKTNEIIKKIKEQSDLIEDVTLLDQYENTRTFHVIYQHFEKNLTNKEVSEIREKILSSLKSAFSAYLKK